MSADLITLALMIATGIYGARSDARGRARR